jgi:hypothetical protein
MRQLLIDSGIPFDVSLLLQRQVESIVMALLLQLQSCQCAMLTIFFIPNALVGDQQWHFF